MQGTETEEKRKEEREGTRDQKSEVGGQKQKKREKSKGQRFPINRDLRFATTGRQAGLRIRGQSSFTCINKSDLFSLPMLKS